MCLSQIHDFFFFFLYMIFIAALRSRSCLSARIRWLKIVKYNSRKRMMREEKERENLVCNSFVFFGGGGGEEENLVVGTLIVCLDIAYFVENWKFIAENTITKYFFKSKNTVYTFFQVLVGPWIMPWDQPKKTQMQKHLYTNARLVKIEMKSIILVQLSPSLNYICNSLN